ncbi:MAG TPA: transferrin receptor-like dimerization domain-containing protein, partial [Vicinamibacteria bacterium]|nr:transferrin receptor-like dimerization domain-containing protein [Vicinamibacteria bacterium]
ADTIGRYVKELDKLAADQRQEVQEANRRSRERVDVLAADSRLRYVPKAVAPEVPHFNLAPLHNAVARLDRAAREYDRVSRPGTLDAARRAALDAVLLRAERAFTRPEGLPRRPWYKHHVYAPGWYTGYGVKTIPAVREAIEQKAFADVEPAVRAAAEAVEAYAAEVERAAALFSGP